MSAAPVTVIARIRAKQGLEARVREELTALLAPTRAEAGCLNYDLHEAKDTPGSFLFHENWTSEDALRRHLESPHLMRFFGLEPELLAGPVEVTLWHRAG